MSGLLARYERLVANGELRSDPAQRKAAERLHRLEKDLEAEISGGLLAQFFARKPQPPRGIYLWGDVGRGKSMLMDLFVDTLSIREKRRVHFHEFMLEVDRLLREERRGEAGDPIARVAARLATGLRCLAFDEMVVTNTADAAIMARLFTALIVDHGVSMVTTSNRPPRDLYKDGLNRSLFEPFIDLIERRLDVMALDGPVDYRMERLGGLACWHTPSGDAATAQVREAFFRLTDFKPEDAEHVPSAELDLGGGRVMRVPKSLKGVAVFSFKRLCAENRGASDYLAIARAYHTVIVVGIPQMGPNRRNEAIRFTKLVDALYEHKVKLFAAAATEPGQLYSKGDGAFEFDRTVSRLVEMQSAHYMALGHGVQG
ncbi:MAG: cell division protein ZapE [Erythrobacter sp. RIFCSPHIGHO2_12_FULL_63_10]|nr:MAG: cell division protein ZapE [Erythrobacter sp. RIFCSPHIGHO2_12_FULL_63_10]